MNKFDTLYDKLLNEVNVDDEDIEMAKAEKTPEVDMTEEDENEKKNIDIYINGKKGSMRPNLTLDKFKEAVQDAIDGWSDVKGAKVEGNWEEGKIEVTDPSPTPDIKTLKKKFN